MKTLSICLSNKDIFWISLLDSEGIPWLVAKNIEEMPVLIMVNTSSKQYLANAKTVLLKGGSVIVEDGATLFRETTHIQTKTFPYEDKHFIGCYEEGKRKILTIQVKKVLRGTAIYLPFSLKKLWFKRKVLKQNVKVDEIGKTDLWENLPFTNKKNVRRIIVDIIKFAYHSAGLPLVQKWYWPGENRSIFSFRADMDAGRSESMLRFLDNVKPWKDILSCFVCGKSYEGKCDLLKKTSEVVSEIGNHTYTHFVYSSAVQNRINLELTERLLEKVGIKPKGYVGPASFWHPSMYDVLQEKGYQYTSSFGVDHDNLPYFPVRNSIETYDLVEIPFHCLGDRFPKFGMGLDSLEVFRFFDLLIDKKYRAGEPITLYGHPDMEGRLGDHPVLIKSIFERALSLPDIWSGNMGELAKWWRERHAVQARVYWYPDSGTIFAKGMNDGPDIFWSIHTSDGRWFLEKGSRLKEGAQIDALTSRTPLSPAKPTDIGEVISPSLNHNFRTLFYNWRSSLRRRVKKTRELKAAQLRFGK